VLIHPLAEKGQTDLIAIGLVDAQGAVVGGASVRDLINIVRGKLRIYMAVFRA